MTFQSRSRCYRRLSSTWGREWHGFIRGGSPACSRRLEQSGAGREAMARRAVEVTCSRPSRHGFPGAVEWVPTYPITPKARLAYLRNRAGWQESLIRKLTESRFEMALFVNHLPIFRRLPFHPRNALWITDAPRLTREDVSPYGRIYITDPGYRRDVERIVGGGSSGAWSRSRCCHRFTCHAGSRRRQTACASLRTRTPNATGISATCSDPRFRFGCSATISSDPAESSTGSTFAPCARRISNERMGEIYARHRASINIHAEVVREGTNMRTFECAGYEIPQVIESRPGIGDLFEPGYEIATYNAPEDLPEVAQWLLGDRARARRMAKRARARALGEHTYQHRPRSVVGRRLIPPPLR